MNLPGGLSSIEFAPFLPMEGARSDGGDTWWTMDADAYWQGRATTTKLNPALLQQWDAFMLEAMFNQSGFEFIDPQFRMPRAYRASGLPVGFAGVGSIVDLADPLRPVASGLPVGLLLKRGDRVGAVSADNKTCHLLTSDVAVASNSAQALPVLPPILDNVFGAGDALHLVDPVIRLTVAPNTWSVPRTARSEPVGSFQVVEASIVT